MKKDTRFWLRTFFEEQEQIKGEYKSFKREIENNGCFIVKVATDTVKIYTPELAVIFGSSNIQARNLDLKTDTIINGIDFIKSFVEGFKEGENYFKTEFSIDAKTMYGQNSELYVKNIHLNFFHVLHSDQIYKGWNFVKINYPILITKAIIKKYGYYSGIVSSVEELIKKHPILFANFYKCEEIKSTLEVPKQEPRKLKSEHYALAYIFDCNSIGESILIGQKTELEKIGKKRADGAISGNTFYKAVTRILIKDKDLNAEKSLIEIAGEDWKEILFELTKYPEELKKYLQSKQLQLGQN